MATKKAASKVTKASVSKKASPAGTKAEKPVPQRAAASRRSADSLPTPRNPTGTQRPPFGREEIDQLLRRGSAKLPRLVDRVAKAFEVSFEKVVAHSEDPGKYPLPADPDSAERRFLAWFEGLPRRERRDLAKEIMPGVDSSRLFLPALWSRCP